MKMGEEGFSLVELLVTMLVASVLAGVVMVTYLLYDGQLRESHAHMLMQRQYENVASQMAMDIRRSFLALNGTEAFANPWTGTAADTTTSLRLVDEDGNILAHYALTGDTLREGSASVAFEAGGGPVLVQPQSRFILSPLRKEVALQLALRTLGRDTTYHLPARKDVFQCRN